jgi:uncharacterized protein (TIGR02268 family)
VRHGNWSGRSFAWDGLSRGCLGTFILLALSFLTTTAHAQQGERQVEAARPLPSCESCEKQLQEAQEETQRCKESSQTERTASGGVDILTGLLVSGRMGVHGISTQDVSPQAPPESPVKVLRATAFRSVDRVAVRLEVQIPEGAPWRMESAVLRDGGEKDIPLRGWPSTPLPPGRSTLVLEREAGEGELTGRYSLEVREAGGMRTLLLNEVRFP